MRKLEPALNTGLVVLALLLLAYIPFIAVVGLLLLPTAILVTVSVLAGCVLGRGLRSRWFVGCGLFLAVSLAGTASRWADKIHAREFYAAQATFPSPLKVAFATPIHVSYDGPSISPAGELRFSTLAARTPAVNCGKSPFSCEAMIRLEWASHYYSAQAHKVLGRMGAAAVTSEAPIRLSTVVEEQARSLLVTTELTKNEALAARSVRHLPKAEPDDGHAVVLWFWFVLEHNLLTYLLGPSPERISTDLFRDFLARAITVTPERPLQGVIANVVNKEVFEPAKDMTEREVLGWFSEQCPVQENPERSIDNNYVIRNLWDKYNSTVASIPTHTSDSLCTQDAFYTFGLAPEDNSTFIMERYDFDGTLRWRHAARFEDPFEHRVTLHRTSFEEVGGRATAVLNVFDYQFSNVNGRRVAADHLLLYERITFEFGTSNSQLQN